MLKEEGLCKCRTDRRSAAMSRAPIGMVAALFVQKRGVYFGLPYVDPWDKERDARIYPGPFPVVAHPPCERWGRYWYGGPSSKVRLSKGDDDGCFESALCSVRKYGGVLEHPEASAAWSRFGLISPPRDGGWISAGDWIGWTCCVEQGNYGHRARKATWLYAVGVKIPSLKWGRSSAGFRLDDGCHSSEERRKYQKLGTIARLPKSERSATPILFRDVLLDMALSVGVAP